MSINQTTKYIKVLQFTKNKRESEIGDFADGNQSKLKY